MAVLLSNYFYFARSELLQRFQRSIEQGIGERRIVNTQALVFLNKEVVPERGCLSLRIIANNNRACIIHQALGYQSLFNLIKFVLDLGLDAIDIQAGCIGMTVLAGGHVWPKGVNSILIGAAHMTGHTSVFHCLVMCTGLAFDPTGTANAQSMLEAIRLAALLSRRS